MQMFRARCASCSFIFDVIATPVPVDVFARVAKRTACPMCGNQKGNTCAPSRDLTDAERAQRPPIGAAEPAPRAPAGSPANASPASTEP